MFRTLGCFYKKQRQNKSKLGVVLFDFLGVVGLLGFIVFLILGIVSIIRRNGKAKKQFLISIFLFVIAFIGILNAPSSDSEVSSEEKKTVDKKEKEIP